MLGMSKSLWKYPLDVSMHVSKYLSNVKFTLSGRLHACIATQHISQFVCVNYAQCYYHLADVV